jgi:hypothetical protein
MKKTKTKFEMDQLFEKHLPEFIILKGDTIVANVSDLKAAKKKAKEVGIPDGPPSKESSVWQKIQI